MSYSRADDRQVSPRITQPARNGWVPVNGHYPSCRCLAYTPNNSDDGMTWRIIPAGMFKQVAPEATHWQPLPAPPAAKPEQ